MTTIRAIPSGACVRHSERAAVTTCTDCSVALCETCVVTPPDIGPLCWDCAAHRAGLRHGKAHPAAPSEAGPPAVSDNALAVRAFERKMVGREPHPLISGLSDALEHAGADPTDVVDDEELIDELEHLQDLAAEPRRRHHLHRG